MCGLVFFERYAGEVETEDTRRVALDRSFQRWRAHVESQRVAEPAADSDNTRRVIRELIAEVLARKEARDRGDAYPSTAMVEAWRLFADEVLTLFNVHRESMGGVVLTFAPAVRKET
jgi:hypothetical protein